MHRLEPDTWSKGQLAGLKVNLQILKALATVAWRECYLLGAAYHPEAGIGDSVDIGNLRRARWGFAEL